MSGSRCGWNKAASKNNFAHFEGLHPEFWPENRKVISDRFLSDTNHRTRGRHPWRVLSWGGSLSLCKRLAQECLDHVHRDGQANVWAGHHGVDAHQPAMGV